MFSYTPTYASTHTHTRVVQVPLKGLQGPKKVKVAGVSSAPQAAAAGPAQDSTASMPLPPMRFNRKRTRISDLMKQGTAAIGQSITVMGWARTIRHQKKICFLSLTDGSGATDLQVCLT